MSEEIVRTHIEVQFWRESEVDGGWTNRVFIRRDEIEKQLRWRHRTVTTTTSYSDWEDGKK